MIRENTKVISIGGCQIGGNHPIAIQSMCNTKTEDVKGTVAQILKLEEAGCDIVRVLCRRWKRQRPLKKSKNKFISRW